MGQGGTRGCMSSSWIPGPPSAHVWAGRAGRFTCSDPGALRCSLEAESQASCSITIKPLIFPCAAEVSVDVHSDTRATSARLL